MIELEFYIDIKLSIEDDDKLCVEIPWADNGYLVYCGELNKEVEENYYGLPCWGYEDQSGKPYGFGESYESLFTKKHEWQKSGEEHMCKLCDARTKGDINNPFNSSFDKVRDTCTQYKFEKFLVALALSCIDDLKLDHNPITFHINSIPVQFAELSDTYRVWKILRS